MNTNVVINGLHFLRPYLFRAGSHTHRVSYVRLFNTTCCRNAKQIKVSKKVRRVDEAEESKLKLVTETSDVEERVAALTKADALKWPRIQTTPHDLSVRNFLDEYSHIQKGQILHDKSVVLHGRVKVIRTAGKSLAFLDIVHDYFQVQIMCNFGRVSAFGSVSQSGFRNFFRLLQRGDFVSVCGNPYRTDTGELSVNVVELPVLLSPTLATLPTKLEDRATRSRNRHVDLLVNRGVADKLRLRSEIIQSMRKFLLNDQFLEVQTPLIADKASGAIAKSFKTTATEFSDKELALRIAPELWLKRLVIGGMDRVFEIGPAFRNEGLDATHNPEFTTCEFYKSFTDLERLMTMTETMFTTIRDKVQELRASPLKTLPAFDDVLISAPFNRIEFVPAIEKGLGTKLPDLAAEDATKELIQIFKAHSHPLPARPTLPRLLDKLASIYIEPDCVNATFIIHHPACMAPLAKSFLDPKTGQVVSARAELFIQNREIANMYEEENSPFEQRAKFVQQGRFVDDENEGYVDESYIRALESALPPTGGWGAGIDRIVMLFSGAARISEVLAFGSLKNVVFLGSTSPIPEPETATNVADGGN